MSILRHIGLAVVLLLGQGQCERWSSSSVEQARLEEGPVQESWDVHYAITQVRGAEDESRPRLHIRAGYMARYERDDTAYTVMRPAEDDSLVTAYLFDEAGDSSATLTAQRLTYFDAEGRLEAQGDVHVRSSDGRDLFSEHLTWNEDTRRIRTPGFVRITAPDERIQGYRLDADEDLSTYHLARITGQVRVRE